MKLKTTKTKVTRFLQTFVVTPLFHLPLFFIFCSPAIPSDCISVDILPDSEHANDMGGKKEEGGGCGEFAAFGFIAPSCSSSSSPSSFPWVEQKWAGEPKHAEK